MKPFSLLPTLRPLLLLALCFAGSVQAADLMQVFRDAQGFDAQYAAARAARDAGIEKLPQARAALLPGIKLTAQRTEHDSETRVRSTGTTTSTRFGSDGWSVSLSQPLFRWQHWIGYQQGGLSAANAEAQLALARQDLIVRVAQAYFDVLLAQESLAAAQAQKTAIALQLEAAKRNFEVGTATITDTHEAQARHDLIVAQEIAAENDLAVKRHALRMLTGKEIAGLRGLGQRVRIDRPQPDEIDQWVTSAENGNIGVQIAQTGFEIARREIERQRAGHLPTLDLVATHGQTNNANNTQDTRNSTLSLQLNLPVFAGGATRSRAREAVALSEKARADLDHARRQAAQSVRQAFLGVRSGLAQVQALEAGVASSQLAVESNRLGYEVGIRINIDVLNAQSQLYDTRQKLAKARLDTLLAKLRLKQATGNLTEADLAAINALLE